MWYLGRELRNWKVISTLWAKQTYCMFVCFHYSPLTICEARYFSRTGFLTPRYNTGSHLPVLSKKSGLLQISLNHIGTKKYLQGDLDRSSHSSKSKENCPVNITKSALIASPNGVLQKHPKAEVLIMLKYHIMIFLSRKFDISFLKKEFLKYIEFYVHNK